MIYWKMAHFAVDKNTSLIQLQAMNHCAITFDNELSQCITDDADVFPCSFYIYSFNLQSLYKNLTRFCLALFDDDACLMLFPQA
jgi:hypothetical protein